MNTIAKKSAALAAAAAIGFGLSGCVSDGPKEQGGAVIGAVLGGVLGSSIGGNVGTRIAGGIAGSLIGGFIGASIGAQLDAADRQALAEMTYVSASQNRPREYYNRSTGVRIKTRPIKTTRVVADNPQPVSTGGGPAPVKVAQICRTVEQEVVLADGTKKTDNIQSCRSSDGNWKVS